MDGNYEKGIYNQLIEVMEKLNDMESERRQARKDISSLTSEVKSLLKENAALREEVSRLNQKSASLEERNTGLEKENRLLHNDNERMKRILNNDSSNPSTPPSKDQPGKAPNTFNSRKPTKKSRGPARLQRERSFKCRCGADDQGRGIRAPHGNTWYSG